jgi:hypothetical protein
MPAPRTLPVDPGQRAELEHMRAHAPQPYLRERAAALLQIAAGQSIRAVAQTSGLRPRRPETVAAWLDRYLAMGIAGLVQRPRRHCGVPP